MTHPRWRLFVTGVFVLVFLVAMVVPATLGLSNVGDCYKLYDDITWVHDGAPDQIQGLCEYNSKQCHSIETCKTLSATEKFICETEPSIIWANYAKFLGPNIKTVYEHWDPSFPYFYDYIPYCNNDADRYIACASGTGYTLAGCSQGSYCSIVAISTGPQDCLPAP